jgi:hypothetical protein
MQVKEDIFVKKIDFIYQYPIPNSLYPIAYTQLPIAHIQLPIAYTPYPIAHIQ